MTENEFVSPHPHLSENKVKEGVIICSDMD